MAVLATAVVVDVNNMENGMLLYVNVAVPGDRREYVEFGLYNKATPMTLLGATIVDDVKEYCTNEMSVEFGMLDTIHLLLPTSLVA